MPSRCRRPRHPAEPRGTILIICLLLMLVASFLAGLLLLLARTEATLSATMGASMQATNAADYGIEFALSNLDPAQPAPFPPQALVPGMPGVPRVQATAGLRDGSNATPRRTGDALPPPGMDLRFKYGNWVITATGWARGWLFSVASAQLQRSEDIPEVHCIEYSC